MCTVSCDHKTRDAEVHPSLLQCTMPQAAGCEAGSSRPHGPPRRSAGGRLCWPLATTRTFRFGVFVHTQVGWRRACR